MTPTQQQALEALEAVIAWDAQRGYIVPYKVRDPVHAAILALEKDQAEPSGFVRVPVEPTQEAPQGNGFPPPSKAQLAQWALDAIEAGPNAALLMNLEGIKDHLRRAAAAPKEPTK